MKDAIRIESLTKDYGGGRGIFDVNLTVEAGEMFGFMGTNGAGKTTTISHMMGFLKPDRGSVTIKGMDARQQASELKKYIGYVPGEIAFPDLPTGIDFLKSQAELLGLKDMTYANELIQKLQLDPSANLRRMSKGMKQKTALVAALMADPQIIILDEPTTGLDPLMRAAFMDIVADEHKRGKTVFMSSHMFEEMESSCGRVAQIDRGRIVDVVQMSQIKCRPDAEYKVEFNKRSDYRDFLTKNFIIVRNQPQYSQVTVSIPRGDAKELLNVLADYDVKFLSEVPYTLERYFKERLASSHTKENEI